MNAAVISNLDIGIVIGYFALVLIIGLLISRNTHTGEELFLGGRSFGWGLIGLSLFASNISSSTIIGLSGAAYSTGIVNSVYEWMSGLPLIIAALIFVPLYLKNRITTIPEYLLKRFDRRSQVIFSSLSIFSTIMIDTAGALYAGSLVLNFFFPDLPLWQTSIMLALIAGIYTAFGGLKAVVYTDAIQAIILIVGCGVLTYLVYEKLDFSWETVVNSVPKDHFSVVRPLNDSAIPWPGLIMGVPLLGFWYWSTNQYIVQRILGSKSLNHARWGVILAGFLKIIPLFIMVFPGAMAVSLYPGLENSDAVFPTLVTDVLPMGMVGLVLAGLVSAILSSVDSALNSSSTLVVIDFIQPMKKDLSEKDIAKYGRITTIILMVIAALWAPQIQHFSGLWAYLQQMFSIIVPPIAVIFLVGVFFKRGNGDGAFWTLVIGTLLGITTFVAGESGLWNLHFTINVGIHFVISTIVFVGVSLMTAPPETQKLEGLTYEKENIFVDTEHLPWYKNYLYQMVLLAALIFAVLFWLW
ncbi:MAG: sodium:solute symporter [Bacteroidota bacterium]